MSTSGDLQESSYIFSNKTIPNSSSFDIIYIYIYTFKGKDPQMISNLIFVIIIIIILSRHLFMRHVFRTFQSSYGDWIVNGELNINRTSLRNV